MQSLFCHESFVTKVEIEWVRDTLLHYNQIVNGANDAATEEMENFTEENLSKTDDADLMVYMTRDSTGNANLAGDVIGRAHYQAACNQSLRRKAHSINEWNEHTHYFGGVSIFFCSQLSDFHIYTNVETASTYTLEISLAN